jgi:uncharacterized cupin superfamily protein/nucleoside-diphosphate-sugar epimerase
MANPNLPPLVIFGCGYVGKRLARAAAATGRMVRACARHLGPLDELRALGVELSAIDASKPKQFGPAMHGIIGASVVYSIPPPPSMPAGEAVRRATQAAINSGVRSFVYLGSAGLYGQRADPDWIDEDTPVAHDDPQMAPRHSDEAAVQGAASAGLRTCVLRLAAIYGPGRGVRARLRKGDYKLIAGGEHYISRIHVDDVVRVILAAEERAPPGSTYLVADDRPTTQREYALWLAARLGVREPHSTSTAGEGVAANPQRGRKLRNTHMKEELGVQLAYPSYLEGEAQIEAEESGGAPAAAPEPPPAPPERPSFVRRAGDLPSDDNIRYPGASELLGRRTQLGDAVGLSRVGVHLCVLPPGRRSSWPHAHEKEEELVYVLEGTPDVWLDGSLHRLAPGDVVGFPAGTGIAHTFLNDSGRDATLLVVGERRSDDRLSYPLHPARDEQLGAALWKDAPRHAGGAHDAVPERAKKGWKADP